MAQRLFVVSILISHKGELSTGQSEKKQAHVRTRSSSEVDTSSAKVLFQLWETSDWC